jgi:redox-sensitive bicupin YhaK (pirin superfamily)
MTRLKDEEPACTQRVGVIEVLIESRARDLGGFTVRRALPAAARRMVGPFIFFDEMGPAQFTTGQGINVRPHPHIGLSTITYLFDGEILHRDSLGCLQPIRPGAVNLMTAGRGIVHSERTSPERLAAGQRLHGIQTWMALPDGQEEIEPAFAHHPAEALPQFERGGAAVTVIAGEAWGARSPVRTFLPTLYLDVRLAPGAALELPVHVPETGIYLVSGQASVSGCAVHAGSLAVLRPGHGAVLRAQETARAMVIGGAPVGERHIFWNFVSSSPQRIEAARQLWASGGFERIAGDAEFIPLPD